MEAINFFKDELTNNRSLITLIMENDNSITIKQEYTKENFTYESEQVIINKKHLKELIYILQNIEQQKSI